MVHTRWHQDDFIGRLCDPDHPERNGLYKGLEKRWTYFSTFRRWSHDPELATALGLDTRSSDVEKPKRSGTVRQCADVGPLAGPQELAADLRRRPEGGGQRETTRAFTKGKPSPG